MAQWATAVSTRIVHRAARTTQTPPDATTWGIERPPTLPEGNAGLGGLLMLVPMLGAGASMTVMMLFRGSSLAAVGALMMILTVLASVLMVFSQRGKAARARRAQREVYLAYLERLRVELRGIEDQRLVHQRRAQPHPRALLPIVLEGSRLWERRRRDGDFLRVRLGVGAMMCHEFERRGDDPGIREVDRFMHGEMERVEARFAQCSDAPVDVDLHAVGEVSVLGDRHFCDRVARIIVAQAATFAAPADLHIALALRPDRAGALGDPTWLPHTLDQSAARDGPHDLARWIARTPADLQDLLGPEIQRRMDLASGHRRTRSGGDARTAFATLLVVADEHGQTCASLLPETADLDVASLGMTVVHLVAHPRDEPGEVSVRIKADPGDPAVATVEVYGRRDHAPSRRTVRLDEWGPAQGASLARTLAGVRLSPDSVAQGGDSQKCDVVHLLGLDDPGGLNLDQAWRPRPPTSFLRVPIGVDGAGRPLMLDLKESAQSGMGPHGLCVGATGSGKSELLRTLVLALVSTHSPDDVALVLVDYKGGATFAPFADAPHVHGVITNLNDDATLIERVYASLAGEVTRRQQMLKDAGSLADITAYRQQRIHRIRAGEEVAPMPHLLVIIDEFGELLTARPDFIELFLSIGRIGRSIGVHLLLSSQRIEAGKLRGLDTYLSYRLGLRTLSESESRTVLETPDAFSLPALPGYGYLKVDTATYSRFRAGYVSGPLPPALDDTSPTSPDVELLSHYPSSASPVLTGARLAHPDEPAVETPRDVTSEGPAVTSVLEATIRSLAARRRVGPGVWSEPLPTRISLDRRGITPAGMVGPQASPRIPAAGVLSISIGVLDDPARQWQGPWTLDLGESTANVLIVGGPHSGRTTLLRTIAAALSLTYDAREVVIYGIDAAGSHLQGLVDLPIVAGIAGRMEPEVTRRIVEEIHATLLERERLFTALRVDSLAGARTQARQAGASQPPNDLADVVLLIDGYGPMVEEHDALVDLVAALIRRGPAYGIRVIATASRRNEMRLNQQTFFGATIEMRLADPAESGVDRKLAQTLTSAVPGRCLLQSRLFAQVALPRIDGGTDGATTAEGLAQLVQTVASAATLRARPLQVLPASLSATDLETLGEALPPGMVTLGLDEQSFTSTMLDLDGLDRHLLIMGDAGTGRTGILRHVASTLVARNTPDELVLAVIDPRHTMRDEIPAEFLGAYAGSTVMATRLVESILPELETRAARLADAAGAFTPPLPRIVLLVDDYDVVSAYGSSPLQALVPYVSMGRELNLNVVLARRTNGASRGIFESAFASLRDSGATGLLLSGERSEGPLFGAVRPAAMPPGRGLLVRAGQAPKTVQTVHARPAGAVI